MDCGGAEGEVGQPSLAATWTEGSQTRLPTETRTWTRTAADGDPDMDKDGCWWRRGGQPYTAADGDADMDKDGCWWGYKDRNEKNN